VNELLSAAAYVGEIWSDSPVIRRFADESRAALTHDEQKPPAPYHQILQMFLTSGSFNSQPLLTGWWLSVLPQREQLSRMSDASAFLDCADRSASALLLTIEWLRSWLPGYPVSFRLPHLDPHASRVTRRGFPNQRLPWPMEMRRASLQFVPEVDDQLGLVLELDPVLLIAPLHRLRSALWASAEWRAFAMAHGELNDDDRSKLDALVDQFRADCLASEDSATARLMTDDAARRAALERCEHSVLTEERLSRYYLAFRAVDQLLEAIGSLITQFAVGEGITALQPAQASWKRKGDRDVKLTLINHAPWIRVNQILYVESPLDALQCLARVEGVTVSINRRLGELSRVTAGIVSMGPDATPAMQPPTDDGGILLLMRRPKADEPRRQDASGRPDA